MISSTRAVAALVALLAALSLACSLGGLAGLDWQASSTPPPLPATETPPPTVAPPSPTATDALRAILTNLPSLAPSATPSPSATPQGTASPSPSATPTISPVACLPEDSSYEYGIVQWVVSGDTIVVDIQGRLVSVRYLGLQAPAGPPWSQVFGSQAKAQNEALTLKRVVRLTADGPDRDAFGQLLRYVTSGRLFVNYELLRQGYAKTTPRLADLACGETFRLAEEDARLEIAGLWAATPIPSRTPAPTRTPLPTRTLGATSTAAASATLAASLTPTQSLTPGPSPTPTQSPTAGPSPTPTSTGEAGEVVVEIVFIFYEGLVPTVESDEYVEIENLGSQAVNLLGWVLYADDSRQEFTFPNFTLAAGASCKVYTNEVHEDSCGGVSFGSSQAIWNNQADCGYLYNAEDEEVSIYCYP